MRPALALAEKFPNGEQAIPAPSPAPARPASKASVLDERAWAEAYMDQAGLTKNAMARLIGYDRSSYSRWLEGKYDGDPAPIAAAIRTLRDRLEGQGGVLALVGFRETRTVAVMWAAAKLAREGGLVITIGESGAGKSEAMKEWRRRAMRSGETVPVYLECTVFTSAAALVAALAEELGLEKRGNPDSLLRACAQKLRRSPRPLLIDEAHRLPEKALDALYQLRDMSGVGILLAATTLFAGVPYGALAHSELMQDILTHRPQLEQLVGRSSIWHVPGLGTDEADGIARDVLGQISDDAVDRLVELTADSIRRLVRLIDEIRKGRASGRRSGAIEPAEVDAAWRRIYSPPSKRARA
jgi:DNA transposition AAA+ family ATPase